MKKVVLMVSGFLLLALAAVGIFVPILPTTPFVLVSAGCFSFASPRLYRIMVNHRIFGPYIDNYRNKTGVPVSAKVRGIIMLWSLLVISALHIDTGWVHIILAVVGVAVTVHLIMLKTRPRATPVKLVNTAYGPAVSRSMGLAEAAQQPIERSNV